MTDDTARFVRALVDLWDRDQRGYTQREVAIHAGWDVDVDYSECPDFTAAAADAVIAGMVDFTLGPDPRRPGGRALLLTPILG
jgi:hypothetical protein